MSLILVPNDSDAREHWPASLSIPPKDIYARLKGLCPDLLHFTEEVFS